VVFFNTRSDKSLRVRVRCARDFGSRGCIIFCLKKLPGRARLWRMNSQHVEITTFYCGKTWDGGRIFVSFGDQNFWTTLLFFDWLTVF
jgi:hypothetical protein